MRPALLALALSFSALVPAVASSQVPQTIPVTVTIRGLRSVRGHVRIALYADAGHWTKDGGDVARCIAPIHGRTATCTLQAPRAGRYAFAFLHDEDDDGQMDRDAIGFPQEGFGFSNDVGPNLGGAPSFQSASFAVAGPSTQTATARYGL